MSKLIVPFYYADKENYHRTDGFYCESHNGDKFWYLNGNYHRENGPAIERFNGDKEWWVNNKLHRLDGPAIDWVAIDGVYGTKQWWYEGEQLDCSSQEEFERLLRLKAFW